MAPATPLKTPSSKTCMHTLLHHAQSRPYPGARGWSRGAGPRGAPGAAGRPGAGCGCQSPWPAPAGRQKPWRAQQRPSTTTAWLLEAGHSRLANRRPGTRVTSTKCWMEFWYWPGAAAVDKRSLGPRCGKTSRARIPAHVVELDPRVAPGFQIGCAPLPAFKMPTPPPEHSFPSNTILKSVQHVPGEANRKGSSRHEGFRAFARGAPGSGCRGQLPAHRRLPRRCLPACPGVWMQLGYGSRPMF